MYVYTTCIHIGLTNDNNDDHDDEDDFADPGRDSLSLETYKIIAQRRTSSINRRQSIVAGRLLACL